MLLRLTAPRTPHMADNRSYDAFISYSRKDVEFVNRLVMALQRYTAPRGMPVSNKRLNVFVDRQDFQTGDYEVRLNQYLANSGKLVVICSPRARGSEFVNQEIRTFAALHGAENIIPVLIAGIPDNEATPASQLEKAFPSEVFELMKMPAAIDYRNFDERRSRIEKGPFFDSWFTLLAAIYDLTR